MKIEGIEKKRSPIVAIFFSVLSAGLGQIYNGQLIKGIVIYTMGIILYIFGFIMIPFLVKSPIHLLLTACTTIALILSLFIYAVIDSYKTARRLGVVKPHWFQRWYGFGAIIFSAIIITTVTSELRMIKAYKIPAASMEPTLIIGDHILINKAAYFNEHPKRGDIVVFEFPEDNEKDFIKRVIGIPGDVVEINNKIVILNGIAIEEKYIKYAEQDKSMEIQRMNNMPSIKIPEGKYFMLGDFRNRSYDSRFWGFVDENKIKGKAFIIYYSPEEKRIFKEIA